MSAHCTTLVCVFDATDPAPVAELPAAVDLIADHGRLVLVVLHPPPGLTLNARLIAWQQARRDQVTAAVLAPAQSHLPSAGLAERGLRIRTIAWHHRRGPGSLHRRVAAALLRLCRAHDADVLVLPAPPHAELITHATCQCLLGLAQPRLRIRRADEHALPNTMLV